MKHYDGPGLNGGSRCTVKFIKGSMVDSSIRIPGHKEGRVLERHLTGVHKSLRKLSVLGKVTTAMEACSMVPEDLRVLTI